MFKLSGSRTPRHGVHLARRPCRFPGQKRAETLCWWLPLPRSVSNKTLTCFSNKRPEVVKSRCPVPKCSIKLWHKQTTTCFCSHILKEKMVQHMHMYMCTCMCICMYNIYIYVYVYVYSMFHWDRMPAAYKWLSVRQLSQSILVMLLHSVQIVLDRSRISVWVLFSTLVLLTVAIESSTYITGCQLHTKFQSECHLAWTWSLIAVEDPSMELMHTSPGLKESNFKNCIHTTDYNTTMNQCLWLSWRTCWTAVE